MAETVEAVDAAPVATGRARQARQAGLDRSRAGRRREVEALADQMLAELAATEVGNDRSGRGLRLSTAPGKRVGLMVGGAIGGDLLLFIVMTILGAVFA